jgi:hypothetical protein
MKRNVLDLTELDGQSVLEWMNAQPTTHVRISGVLLTRAQIYEFERLGRTGGALAQARFLEELRDADKKSPPDRASNAP